MFNKNQLKSAYVRFIGNSIEKYILVGSLRYHKSLDQIDNAFQISRRSLRSYNRNSSINNSKDSIKKISINNNKK